MNVSSIFVTGNTVAVGDADAVGVGDGEGVDVGVGVGVDVGVGVGVDVGVGDGDGVRVGAGVTLSLNAEDAGDDCPAGEISSCGEGVLLGAADVAAFEGAAVGDLRGPDGELFDFGVGVGVGLRTGVCVLRSTPMWAPRFAALPTLDGVADGFTRGFKAEKKDRFGVGVGVGVGAALSDNIRPSSNADFSQKILPLIIHLR